MGAVTDYRTGQESRPRWLPNTSLVALELDGGRVLVRPSGTEPKLKIYVDLRADFDAGDAFLAREEALTSDARAIGAEMAEWLGI